MLKAPKVLHVMSMGVLGIGATDDSLYMVGGECDTSVEKYDVD